jgi:subfamily B ATP-binding cassette protein MsbA
MVNFAGGQTVSDETLSTSSYDVGSALRLGLSAASHHLGLVAVLMTATLAQGALQGLLVWALREVLLTLSHSTSVGVTGLVAGASAIFVIWSLRALSTVIGEVVSARLSQAVQTDAMVQVLGKLLTLSVRFFERNSQSDLVMTAFQDLRGLRTVTLSLGTIVLSVSRLLGLAVAVWMMSPKLTIIGLIAVPLGAIPAHWLGRRMTLAAKSERATTARLHDGFLQVTSGIRLIKVNRGEARLLARTRAVGQELYRYANRQSEASNLARFLMESVSGIGLIVVLVVGGRDVAAGTLEWQSLLGLLIAMMAVYSPIVSLLSVYSAIRSAIPTLDRVREIMREQPDLPDAADAQPLSRAPRIVELQDVGFAYRDRPVLEHLSARFEEGETIGIVGPSGAGKSTLLGLMLRFYDPTAGRILLDGVDLRRIRHADLMDHCAIVLQEPFLFIDTVANNIRFTRPTASMDEVIAAAKAANVHDEIVAMEHGYETILGRHREAQGISVGQKQRICIAAALLKNAPILFLDEATSNLDSVSEHAVQGAIDRLMSGRTSFVIAHRLSTLRNATRLLVLDQGRMAGLGTHRELLAGCLTYQRLWSAQVGDHRGVGGESEPALRAVP